MTTWQWIWLIILILWAVGLAAWSVLWPTW